MEGPPAHVPVTRPSLCPQQAFARLWEVGTLERAGGLCDPDSAHPQAPDWVDAEECHRCRVQFGVVTRKVSALWWGRATCHHLEANGPTHGPVPLGHGLLGANPVLSVW